MTQLLKDFKDFFNDYKAIWNKCDTEGICEVCSTELHVRWAYPDNSVSDWEFKEACDGWEHAFSSYDGRNPKWIFHEVTCSAINENEVLAVFWVTFEIDGKATKEANLFVETFRKESIGWKLIRSYVESSIPKLFVSL